MSQTPINLKFDTGAPAPRNHNNPPSELEMLGENLTLRYVGVIRQAEEHGALSAQFPEVFTEQLEADFTSDFIKKALACYKDLEAARKDEKEPFLRQGQYVDTFFNNLKDGLSSAIETADKPLKAYLQKQAREEQERREKDAEDMRKLQVSAFKDVQELAPGSQHTEETTKAVEHLVTMNQVVAIADKDAQAPIVTMAAAGGKVSKARLTEKWVGTLADRNQLDLMALRPYLTDAALQVAINQFVKMGGRTLLGAKIEKEINVKVK